MDLRSTQLKDTYGNLVTTGTTEGSPTSGGLQNGQGTLLTSVGIGTDSPAFTNGSGLEVERAGIATLRLQNTSTAKATEIIQDTNFEIDTLNSGMDIILDATTDTIFEIANSEIARINSTGLGIGTTSPDDTLHVYSSSTLDHIRIDGTAGINRNLNFSTAGSARWNIYATGTAESGSNAGTDLSIARYTDAGSFIDSVLTITRSSGNIGIGTTSPAVELDVDGEIRASSGILFGTDTATANALDDYEEGTFDPVIVGSTTPGTPTYSHRSGNYTKIGDLVHFNLNIVVTDWTGSPAGEVRIEDLPFVSELGQNSRGYAPITTYVTNYSGYTFTQNAYVQQNSDYIRFGDLPDASADTAFEIRLAGTYKTDS